MIDQTVSIDGDELFIDGELVYLDEDDCILYDYGSKEELYDDEEDFV
jgi:hypothetical protein